MRRISLLLLAVGAVALEEAPKSELTHAEHLERWAAATAAAQAAEGGTSAAVTVPERADEWYTVTIADVSVGYMHTTLEQLAEPSLCRTMEVMDVQVSRGQDTSRMAFETVFEESPLDASSPASLAPELGARGGVSVMAYDQRFANNEVRMKAHFNETNVELISFNGEKEHVSDLDLPEEAWLGRLRARLEFTRQCREGATEIVVKTMRPELGPRVVSLSSTFVKLDSIWDGASMVEASVWTVQISDVPVNMTETYPTQGPERCYRMLQMGLDMPFGYLLASLSSEKAWLSLTPFCHMSHPIFPIYHRHDFLQDALAAAVDDPNRKLPELVYTMFVPLSAPIPRANDARLLRLEVKVKGDKGPAVLKLPSAGYQEVTLYPDDDQRLSVRVDLQDPLKATPEELADEDYRKPSAMVDNSDTAVINLAHAVDARLRAAGVPIPRRREEPVPAELVHELVYALRDLVHNHIDNKHLSTAYASASETARTGSGDCTEHAVLLAAVLKARGVPARVCHGLVYIEQGGSAITGAADETAHVAVDEHGNPIAPLTGQVALTPLPTPTLPHNP